MSQFAGKKTKINLLQRQTKTPYPPIEITQVTIKMAKIRND